MNLSVLCDPSGILTNEHKRNRDPAGIRTQGPYIKSVMLYQLSYGIMHLKSLNAGAKICS